MAENPIVGTGYFYLDLTSLQGAFISVEGLNFSFEHQMNISVGASGRPENTIVVGKNKHDDITLKEGICDGKKAWKWMEDVRAGQIAASKLNGSLVLFDAAGKEQMRYNLFGVLPKKYVIDKWDASGNGVAQSSLTIACERIEMAG